MYMHANVSINLILFLFEIFSCILDRPQWHKASVDPTIVHGIWENLVQLDSWMELLYLAGAVNNQIMHIILIQLHLHITKPYFFIKLIGVLLNYLRNKGT